jgi:hypothetical protein
MWPAAQRMLVVPAKVDIAVDPLDGTTLVSQVRGKLRSTTSPRQESDVVPCIMPPMLD